MKQRHLLVLLAAITITALVAAVQFSTPPQFAYTLQDTVLTPTKEENP